MRKILIAFDGVNYSEAALRFAAMLNEKNPVMIAGAFIPQTILSNLWSYAGAGQGSVPLVGDDSAKEIQKNIQAFEYYCIGHNIEYRIHKDYFDFAIPELKKETRFADLLIISSEAFYENMGTGPNEYLQQTLHDVECPVLLIPDKFDFPTCNILAYDDSRSSVYAIKQFAYLLPELADNETTLVYAKNDVDEPLPNGLNIEELAGRHFRDLNLLRFGPDPKKYFNTWLTEQEGGILVTGSYGRSDLYRLFHKSFIAEIIKEHKIPIFVAHC